MSVDQAWKNYLAVCEEMRQLFLAQDVVVKYPALAANAHFVLQQTQALAYNLVMAPRQDHPYFYLQTYLAPLIYTAHQPCPDFPYRLAFVNGARTWRIHGNRNTAHWVDIQVATGWWGEAEYRGIGNYDMDDFDINADGSFEIIASADEHAGNWIRLDASHSNNTIMIRPAMYDWDTEIAPSVFIEAMDDLPSTPVTHDEAEIIRRLRLSGSMVRHSISEWTTAASPKLQKKLGFNNFLCRFGDAKRGGANPLANYAQAVYEIAADEALIVEVSDMISSYWGISLGTWWWETTDFTLHKSSINGHQAVIDSDGVFRAVVAGSDPGVPNWLDTAGWEIGMMLIRFYRAEKQPRIATKKIKLSDVRDHLPVNTPCVTLGERKLEIDKRRRAVMRWYGYEK